MSLESQKPKYIKYIYIRLIYHQTKKSSHSVCLYFDAFASEVTLPFNNSNAHAASAINERFL